MSQWNRAFDLKFLFLLFGAFAAAGAASACRSPQSGTPAPAAVSPDTWATVDGRPITKEAVDKAYRRTRDVSQTLSEEETLTAKLSLLNDMIVQDILIARAGALKVEVPQSDLDTAYENAKKNLSNEAYQQELTKRSLTADDMKEGLRREMLTQKVIEQEVGSKIAVSDTEINDFFTANRAQFNVAEESYHIAQIVVTPAREPQIGNSTGDDAVGPAAAAAKVQMLMERLKGGTPFHELAMSYSEDPESARRGGDLGLVPVSKLNETPPALRNAVLGKSPGTATVATVNGVHTVVLVLAKEAPGQRDLSTPEVRSRITARLRATKEQLLRSAYLTTARTEADVVNLIARRIVESSGRPAAPPVVAPAK
jgi:parvulin-like peptidyl-prolyl isomerase